ncbi:hypothetical protein AK812_SmicGene16606 [Symbiodinium microadriaticum]|uniref:Uncharacterized protein n=1 Tax=Symbiodinium microadriaticum TaxID=2951 RepID=A0A1Q9DZW6_SYMMI|nr:hypothetical protein AK812_SmicGene16606 [Symbiodinium microadriaticum]
MFSASFRARVEKDIPWVLEAGYDHDEPSGKMRRERFIYMLEFGHQLLARAIEREGVATGFIEGLDMGESLDTQAGMQMVSRILPGGLLFMAPFRGQTSTAGVKEVFLSELMLLCHFIRVRVIFSMPLNIAACFEKQACLQEAAEGLKYVKASFVNAAFASSKQFRSSLANTRKKALVGMPTYFEDLDECFLVNKIDIDPIRDGRKRDLTFEAEDFYVTRTHSTRSLPSAPTAADLEAEDPARNFMLQTARRSLDEVLAGSSKDADKGKDKKGKKKDIKKDKKSKQLERLQPGRRTSSVASCDVDDAAALLGLSKKDLVRPGECMRLDDLGTKQMAMVLSGVTDMLPPSEIYETGGEETLLMDRCKMAGKGRKNKGEVLKFSFEDTSPDTRMPFCAPVCGRAPANIPLGNAKSLNDCSAFVRNLYRKHTRKTGKDNVEKILGNTLQKLREAATQDLNNQLKGTGKESKKEVKEEKEEDEEKEAKEEEADSQQSADEGSPEPEPEKAEDDDDDDDVFQGEFSRKEKKKPCATEGGLEGVATNAKALLDKFEAGLTATFPKELSQTDMTNWIRMLDKECLYTLDDMQAALKMDGTLSQNLNVGKYYYNKMSIKAKSVFSAWAQSIGTSNGSMAAMEWLRERLKQLSECEDESARAEIQKRLQQKITFVDVHLQEGKGLGDLNIDKVSWEDAISNHRSAAAMQLVPLRPRIFEEKAIVADSPAQRHQEEASPETPSPGHDYSSTEVFYLRTEKPLRGVLQLHKVPEKARLQGYRYLLRAEEIWGMAKRAQHFTNWCTKLQDGLGLDVAEAWKVDVDVHMVRKASYKGRLKISRGYVTLESWRSFLDFSGLQQWQNCKLLAKEEQDVDTGIPLATAAWFILRQPHQEMLQIEAAEENASSIVPGMVASSGAIASLGPSLQLIGSSPEALANMDVKSLAVLCDASPKAKMVWLPVFAVPGLVSMGTLQRLSTQELKALANVLSHVNISLDDCFPTHPLIPAKETETRVIYKQDSKSLAYLHDRETGESRWDVPVKTDHLRLVVCPDQGGMTTLCGWLFRAKKSPWNTSGFGCTLAEAKPDDVLMEMFQHDILKENDMEETSDSQLNFTRVMDILGKVCKWCAWAHTSKRFQMTASLLLILWAAMEVGKNPFKILETEAAGNQKSFDKTVDLCVKALTNEESYGIFRVARNVLEPFRELCLELVLRLKFRRCSTYESILKEGFGLYLSTVHEMMQYTLYLRSSPHCAAALVSEKEADDGKTKQSILKRMQAEWQAVLSMESKPASAVILAASCHHTRYQHYRELMSCLEKHEFVMTTECKQVASAWNPSFCQSASLESMFGEMSDAVKRAGRSDCGSLPNLHAVGVRSLFRRVCKHDGSPQALELQKEAVRLKQLPYRFTGSLPQQQDDETRVPCRSRDDWWDPLLEGMSTPALTLDIGRALIQQLRFDYDDVILYGYSLHMCDKALEDKCGSSLLFRRGFQEFSLLCYLVQSQEILQTSSASLSELLHKSDVQMPKNSTKNQKIRRLLSLQAVKQACGEARLLRLLAKLDEQDEKRKRKQESKDEELQQPEGDIDWEELNDDPATAACRELLSRLDEEEEQEDAAGNAEARPADGIPEDANRASRAMLSNSTASLPEKLVAEQIIAQSVL